MPLEIGVLSSNIITVPTNRERVPPGWSGSPEQIMLQIADGMVKRGHRVTLFATGESSTLANLEFVNQKSSYEDPTIGIENRRHKPYEYQLAVHCYNLAEQFKFDLVHSRFVVESGDYAAKASMPTVSTIHTPPSHFDQEALRRVANAQHYVSISQNQRQGFEFLNYAANIYHGVDLPNFPFEDSPEGHLAFVGRFHEQKGPHIAIEAAQALGIKLEMVGSNWGDKEKAWGEDPYWEETVKKIDPALVTQAGFVDNHKIAPYFARARASLDPIQWDEAFGLTIIESMATGTPVIAFARGSTPELIVDGVTGFLVNPSEDDTRGSFITQKSGLEGFKEAIERVYNLSSFDYARMRRDCRRHVEANFTLDRMLDEYEKTYFNVLAASKS